MALVKILYADSDRAYAHAVKRDLNRTGHVVDLVHDGRSAKHYAECCGYDAILLDVLLSAMNGLALTSALRRAGNATPIVILTVLSGVEDAIAGLDAGASDYVRKPCVNAELHARLRAVTRAGSQKTCVIGVRDVTLNLATREARRDGRVIPMSIRETAFLEYFMQRAGHVVTRSMLEDALWEHGRYVESNVAEVYVSRLRRKLHIAGKSHVLTTVRGAGHRFT